MMSCCILIPLDQETRRHVRASHGRHVTWPFMDAITWAQHDMHTHHTHVDCQRPVMGCGVMPAVDIHIHATCASKCYALSLLTR